MYVGSSALVSTAGMLGAAGAILAVANVVAEDCVAAWEGDAAAQLRLTGPHVAAKAGFPHGLKRLVAERFGTSTAARMGRRVTVRVPGCKKQPRCVDRGRVGGFPWVYG